MDVLEGVAEVCVDVATEVWLIDRTEVPRLEEDEEADVSVVPEEMEFVGVALNNTEEPTAVDSPILSIVEKGYGSSAVVRLVSQQGVPPRSCPDVPPQHQLLPLDSQRLTSV